MSFPVNDLHAIAFVDVAETVHLWLYSAYSLEEVVASHVALGTPVQDPFRGSMRHDDINGIRYRLFSDGGRSVGDVTGLIEPVFVVLVCECPVAKGRRVRGDVDCKSDSASQPERVRAFVQERDAGFDGKRPIHGFYRQVAIFRIFRRAMLIALSLPVSLIEFQVVISSDDQLQFRIYASEHLQRFLERRYPADLGQVATMEEHIDWRCRQL